MNRISVSNILLITISSINPPSFIKHNLQIVIVCKMSGNCRKHVPLFGFLHSLDQSIIKGPLLNYNSWAVHHLDCHETHGHISCRLLEGWDLHWPLAFCFFPELGSHSALIPPNRADKQPHSESSVSYLHFFPSSADVSNSAQSSPCYNDHKRKQIDGLGYRGLRWFEFPILIILVLSMRKYR